MQNTITVSAPGKLMIFGEHAVVYGKPSIVTAVEQRLSIKASILEEPMFNLSAPDVEINNYSKLLSHAGTGEIPKGAKFVEHAVKNFIKAFPEAIPSKMGVEFETINEFKSTFGFGSSSASAVCTVKALSELYEINLDEKQIFDIAYQTVLDVQGVGSGFDLAAAIYGETLYFVTGGKKIESLQIKKLPLVVGYTGTKADTATIVREVKARFKDKQPEFDQINNSIETIVEEAKIAFTENDFKTLGELMNKNQTLLEKLGVSTNKLSSMINASRNAGAFGAKLSGAGGGDCMIALVPENKRSLVEKAIQNAGGKVLKVEVNAVGVRLEK